MGEKALRNNTLDTVKSIGIILVVLYHAIGINTDALVYYDNGLFNMIACFFMQLFFIVSGYLYQERIRSKGAYACLVLFPLCGYLLGWMIPYQNADYGIIGLSAITPALINGQGLLIGIMISMAFLGAGFVYAVARILRGKVKTVFAYLGKISIGIYLLHILFVGISGNIWLSTLIALAISVGLYEGLRRNALSNRILFGS